MNLYLPIEIYNREFQSKLLIAMESASRGMKVYMGRVSEYLLRDFFVPGIVLYKSITPSDSRLEELKFFKKNNFIITSMDEEVGLVETNTKYLKERYANKSLELTDKVFTWGQFDYNNLSKISEKHYIIDKLPSNFRWLGLILNSFPEAKIIHIDRNPMAVCWSNYKTNFVYSGMDYTLTQEDTADYYSLYYDLMKFWKNKFDKKFFNINYDDFVQNFEFHTKKILSYLNLKWEDNLKNYEKTNRVVITASYQQVRGKIRKDTSLEWKKYAEYLNPMQKILEKNKIKF